MGTAQSNTRKVREVAIEPICHSTQKRQLIAKSSFLPLVRVRLQLGSKLNAVYQITTPPINETLPSRL